MWVSACIQRWLLMIFSTFIGQQNSIIFLGLERINIWNKSVWLLTYKYKIYNWQTYDIATASNRQMDIQNIIINIIIIECESMPHAVVLISLFKNAICNIHPYPFIDLLYTRLVQVNP